MNLKNYRAENFSRDRPLLIEIAWRLVSALVFQPIWVHHYGFKRTVLRLFGARVGAGVLIKPRVTMTFPWKLTLGDHVWIGEGAWIDNLEAVSIGHDSVISQGAYICTGNHDFRDAGFALKAEPVTIEAHVWVGAMSRIAPGVILKEHSVIALGSVVTQDCEKNTVYAGNPAVIKGPRYKHTGS